MKGQKANENFFQLVHFLSQNQNYIKVMEISNQIYDLRSFKVKTLLPTEVTQIFKNLKDKMKQIDLITLDTPWLQNERRIFLWLIFGYCFRKKIEIQQLNQNDWKFFSTIFPRRDPLLFRYQLNLIQRQKGKQLRKQKWAKQQNEILTNVVKQYPKGFRWNDVAKRFFMVTKQKYFRTPKQCREQWINHLDPNRSHSKWLAQQDEILMQYVELKGKKWAAISKALRDRRTQHMVKNRYNTIIKSLRKRFPGLSQSRLVSNYKKYQEINQSKVQESDSRILYSENALNYDDQQDQAINQDGNKIKLEQQIFTGTIKIEQKQAEMKFQEDCIIKSVYNDEFRNFDPIQTFLDLN